MSFHHKALLALTWAIPAFAHADNYFDLENLHIQGAVWQGFTHTSNNLVFGPSDDTVNPQVHGALIAANWRLSPSVRWDGQVSWVQLGDSSPKDFNVNVFSLDLNFYQGQRGSAGIRFGRLRNTLWLYNEVRDIPHTHPMIFLPQSMYLDRGRQVMTYGDAASAYYSFPFEHGVLRLDAGFGKGLNDRFDIGFFGIDLPGSTESALQSWLYRLRYRTYDGSLILNLAHSYGKVNYHPAAVDIVQDRAHMSYSPFSLGIQWSPNDRWTLTSEAALSKRSFINFEMIPTAVPAKSLTWYLQSEYRLTASTALTLRYDSYTVDTKDTDGEDIEARLGVPRHFMFARDWAIGMRWNPVPNWLFQLEYHNVDGTAWVDFDQDLNDMSRHWDMIAAQVAYRFQIR